MDEQRELKELIKGDALNHFLLVKKSELRATKTGKDYLSLELGDQSASLGANLWDNFEIFINTIKVGDVVKVTGSIDDFQGTPQIRINSIKASVPSDNVFPADFLPRSKRDINQMEEEFRRRSELISNKYLNELLQKIFNEERYQKFIKAPAGKSWHHGYIHGLLEHTLEIIKICDLMCDFHFELNRDLLICGAMLHDLGKITELSYNSVFDYTDKGKLIGHIVIGAIIIEEESSRIKNFPVELKNNLLHLVLSHQGKLEHASPVVPKTIEAIALYQADELSAKVNAYKNALLSEMKSDSKWTRFITLAQTDLYKFEISEELEAKIKKSLFD
ncbi:MAG TPA: HD domain-containing protein [Ignavibacteriaceae bacterium]|nr:HD domain-containing protein [Ignavibacteriaceae bacterium]